MKINEMRRCFVLSFLSTVCLKKASSQDFRFEHESFGHPDQSDGIYGCSFTVHFRLMDEHGMK